MRVLSLICILAASQAARAGQISDFFWQTHTTNGVPGLGGFAGSKLAATNHGITEIGIERTACFGSCPVYTCLIYSDGKVRYHGERHVDKVGDWETTINPYDFHNLANYIVQSEFWQMHDTFGNGVTDGATVYTTFVLSGRRKVFSNYAGGGPPKLWALQQLIDGLVAGATWHPAAPGKATK